MSYQSIQHLEVVGMAHVEGVDIREVLRMRCQQVRSGETDPSVLQVPQGFCEQLLRRVEFEDQNSALVGGLVEPVSTLGDCETECEGEDGLTTLGWSPEDVEGTLNDEVVN